MEAKTKRARIRRAKIAGPWLARLEEACAWAWRPQFTGEIYENAANVRLGRGYANAGKKFDPESAKYILFSKNFRSL